MLWQTNATRYRIVAPRHTDISLRAVIHDFASVLQQMSGAVFCIVTDDTAPSDYEIIIGGDNARLSRLGFTSITEGLSRDGYEIRSVGSSLVIAGAPPRGTINGIYGFLQDHLGCRWLTPGVQHIPTSPAFPFPVIQDRQNPAFEIRSTNYAQHYDANWTVRNRINRCFAEFGDKAWAMLMDDDRAKTLFNYFPPHSIEFIPEERFGSRRDLIALVNETRIWPDNVTLRALCLQAEGVEQFVAELLFETADKHRMQGWTPQIFCDLSFSDSAAVCQCDKCRKSLAANGHSLHHLTFVNRVASIVEKHAPDVRIVTLAYGTTFLPTDLKMHDNVIVTWCPINACVMHELDGCPPNLRAGLRLADLDHWLSNSRNLQVWYYNYQGECWLPHPRLFAMQRNYATFKRKGVIGIFTEAPPCHEGHRDHPFSDGDGKLLPALGNVENFGYFTCNIELHHIRAYITCRLMWDVNLDLPKALSEFCAIYYGPAAAEITEYVMTVENPGSYAASRGSTFRQFDGVHLDCGVVPLLKPDVLERLVELVEIALQKTSHDTELHRRVEMIQASTDLYRITLTSPDSAGRHQAQVRFFDLQKALGIQRLLLTPVSFSSISPVHLQQWFDDSEKLRIPGFETYDVNILRNHDFSSENDGRPFEWRVDGEFKPDRYILVAEGVTLNSGPHAGCNLKLSKTPSPGKSVGITQQVGVLPGQRYVATVRYVSNMKQGAAKLVLVGYDSRGNWIRNLAESSLIQDSGGDCVNVTVEAIIPIDIGRLGVRVALYNDMAAGDVWIEQVECTMRRP